MSMELMVKAMKIRVGNPLRKLVLIKLADNASDQGECWPSYGSKWDVIRVRVLQRDKGLCQLCLRAGVAREAKTVDHIIPKAHGGTDADSNLQSLCWPCHKAKTARERLK